MAVTSTGQQHNLRKLTGSPFPKIGGIAGVAFAIFVKALKNVHIHK